MNDLAQLVREYREQELPQFIPRREIIRELPEPKRFNLVHIITGMRRSGKTFYLFQKMSELIGEGFPSDRILFFNFSDDRLLPHTASMLSDVVEEYFRQVPKARELGAYLFLDEVQECSDWEATCQRLAETEKVSLVITGSSSKLSSEQIATKFRGRSHSHEMLPLSFAEFCLFNGVEPPDPSEPVSQREQTRLKGLFDEYLVKGGFPGVQSMIAEDRIEMLQSYVRDVVARDVSERFEREDIALAHQLALFGLRNTGCELSVNGLVDRMKELGYKIYWEKADKVLRAFQDAFLICELNEFTMALKPSTTSNPKVYAIDQGLAYAVSRANQQDIGKRLETAVYLELRRRLAGSRTDTITSFTVPNDRKQKVDFIIGDSLGIEKYELFQVSVSLEGESTRKREIDSLSAAMSETGLEESKVIAIDDEESIEVPSGLIEVIPAWRWFLG